MQTKPGLGVEHTSSPLTSFIRIVLLALKSFTSGYDHMHAETKNEHDLRKLCEVAP